jgi:hypothetical protein
MSEQRDKEIFVKMCAKLQQGSKIYYPEQEILHSSDNKEVTEYENYDFLLEKMHKLEVLLNSDLSLIEKDIETEIWEMI